MNFPTLYKKTNTGAIQQWTIDTRPANGTGLIVTTHGQVDGAMQVTSDTITAGKNVGKKNETSPAQQAEAEAQAKWTKQKKKGYVESLEQAQAGEVDSAVILGGFLPMLAPSEIYPHFAKHIKFPAWQQPKLDGIRCETIREGGKITLWTRTRKPILSMPHIVAAIESHFASLTDVDFRLDGELYNHELKNQFENLVSMVANGDTQIQYHIYDMPMERDYFYRMECVRSLFVGAWENGMKANDVLCRVDTVQVMDEEDVRRVNERHFEMGYEGSMLRNEGPYEYGKRSKHLQKLKAVLEEECKIIGVEEGRGKDAGTVGAFMCVTADGVEVRARLKATYDRRRELFAKPELWTGKKLTIIYQNKTADGSLRCPRGKAIRDYE